MRDHQYISPDYAFTKVDDSLLRIMRTLGKLDVLQPLIEDEQLSPSEYYEMVKSSKTMQRKRAVGRLNSKNTEESEW